MGSQIVAVRQLFVAGIAALPAITTEGPTGQSVEVSFGYKVGSKRRERLWTQDARFNHKSASMRATKTFRDERGEFKAVLLVEGLGLSIEETSERALSVGTEVEDWCATHANWQGLVPGLNWLEIDGDGDLAEAFNDKGSVSQLTYQIRYQARLT